MVNELAAPAKYGVQASPSAHVVVQAGALPLPAVYGKQFQVTTPVVYMYDQA